MMRIWKLTLRIKGIKKFGKNEIDSEKWNLNAPSKFILQTQFQWSSKFFVLLFRSLDLQNLHYLLYIWGSIQCNHMVCSQETLKNCKDKLNTGNFVWKIWWKMSQETLCIKKFHNKNFLIKYINWRAWRLSVPLLNTL